MDDYAGEIRGLQSEVDQMVEAEEDEQTIAELELQIGVLRALYDRARELQARGESDPDLRQALMLRGYGAWTLDNVYAFIYEAAVDLPTAGHREFITAVRHTDFGEVLEARLNA